MRNESNLVFGRVHAYYVALYVVCSLSEPNCWHSNRNKQKMPIQNANANKKTPSTECALRNSIKIDPLIFVAKPSDCLAESHRNISKTNRIHSPFVCCFFSAECAVSTAFFLTFFSFFLTVLHSSALIMLEHVVSHLCYEISSHTLTFTLGTLAKHMRCV